MLWITLALMTGAVVLCVVWPMTKPRSVAVRADGADVAFYKNQLTVLDGEIAAGAVSSAEAQASRAEIGRRLIAAVDRADEQPSFLSRKALFATAAAIIVFVPAVSLSLYLKLGAPAAPDLPLASRQSDPAHDGMADAVTRVESHLAAHPEDGRGWDLLAPIYLRLGRFDDAVHAYDRALALQGETSVRRAGYGQALMLRADGVVTAEARDAFNRAFADDPKQPQPQFFLGMAALQDGDKSRARALWTDLLSRAPADAPWRSMIESKLAELDGTPIGSGPASVQGAAIAALPVAQQRQAIQGMVDGLAARLAQNGQDREGWLKLVRAYTVLGEKGKAVGALADARRNLSADAAGLDQLNGLARELGLDS